MQKRKFKPKQYLLIIAFIAGWSINALSQNLRKEDFTLYKDIVYTVVDGFELKLDIAVPKYLDSPAPAIVDIPEGETLARGKIFLEDLSTEKKRTFQQNFVLSGVDFSEKEIMWNFRGEIFDSELIEKFEPMFMQGEKFDDSIEGIGYHIQIGKNKEFNIEKKIYRN